jgi:Predicted ATPase (AAA+ superfamily)
MLLHLSEAENLKRTYVSLDDTDARYLAKSDPKLFFQTYPLPVLIDEIQYAPELFPHIKLLADTGHLPGGIWLTGSQKYQMIRGVSESLAGRVAVAEMYGLSLAELYRTPPHAFSFDVPELLARERSGAYPHIDVHTAYSRMFTGSLPKAASGDIRDSSTYYANYVRTYVERDIRELAGITNTLSFSRFLSSLAARCSQQLNYAECARDAEISEPTAKSWVNVLISLGIVFLVQPYFSNALKRITKTPKLYFHDCGLVAWLCRWLSPETLEAGAMNGAIMENFVVSELWKSYANNLREPPVWYYRDKEKREIDLLVEENGKLHPVEIKKSASPSKDMIASFRLLDTLALPRGNGAVICLADRLVPIDRENAAVPLGLM